jgi:4-hydroxybenzoate polyprenyltransferase
MRFVPCHILSRRNADGLHTAWGIAMAAYKTGLSPHELVVMTLAYALGATLLHSAACVINDICDRDFDRQVGKNLTFREVRRSLTNISNP